MISFSEDESIETKLKSEIEISSDNIQNKITELAFKILIEIQVTDLAKIVDIANSLNNNLDI